MKTRIVITQNIVANWLGNISLQESVPSGYPGSWRGISFTNSALTMDSKWIRMVSLTRFEGLFKLRDSE